MGSNDAELSLAQAKGLIAQTHKAPSAATTVPKVFEGSDLHMLQIAVKCHHPVVVLGFNKRFTLHYEKLHNMQKVYFKPERGQTPCGWLDINKLLAGSL